MKTLKYPLIIAAIIGILAIAIYLYKRNSDATGQDPQDDNFTYVNKCHYDTSANLPYLIYSVKGQVTKFNYYYRSSFTHDAVNTLLHSLGILYDCQDITTAQYTFIKNKIINHAALSMADNYFIKIIPIYTGGGVYSYVIEFYDIIDRVYKTGPYYSNLEDVKFIIENLTYTWRRLSLPQRTGALNQIAKLEAGGYI